MQGGTLGSGSRGGRPRGPPVFRDRRMDLDILGGGHVEAERFPAGRGRPSVRQACLRSWSLVAQSLPHAGQWKAALPGPAPAYGRPHVAPLFFFF